MSDREPDIEFDFFEEPETREASCAEATAPCAARWGAAEGLVRRAARSGRTGFTPLLRLLGLIAFAILIVVLLLLWVQSCQEDQKRDAYGELHDQHGGDWLTTPSASDASSATL